MLKIATDWSYHNFTCELDFASDRFVDITVRNGIATLHRQDFSDEDKQTAREYCKFHCERMGYVLNQMWW